MENLDINEIGTKYFDVLKEIGNIGAGNATTALAQLMGSRVDMTVPQVKLMEFHELGTTMGGEDQVVAAVYLVVEGDINGSIMFMMSLEAVNALIKRLIGTEHVGETYSDMEVSAIKEMGNIITGAYLNSISTLTNLTIYPSVPDLAIDMAGSILSVPAAEFGVIGDKMLLIQTSFSNEIDFSGYFILVPDEGSYARILGSLGF
ncbi:MAG: chemotaxis protein CheC [Lachnospiraceae bacterium]|nr:chemotaxis protein CheC [Lachnospiraceae bacterium]